MIMVEYQEFVLQYSDLIDYVKEWLIGFSPVVPLSRVALHINDCRRWLNVHIIARKRYIVPYNIIVHLHIIRLDYMIIEEKIYVISFCHIVQSKNIIWLKWLKTKLEISRDRDFAIGDINIGILWNFNIWELEVLIR